MPDQDVRGKSLLDLLWLQLDQFVDSYQELAQGGYLEEAVSEERGKCHGAAVALALVVNPYHPDLASIKAEAMERWAERTDQPEEPQDDNDAARRYEARRARRRARRAARNS